MLSELVIALGVMPLRIAWDISHQEFTIFDYYYFSKLLKLIERNYEVFEAKSSRDWKDADVIVVNYPEKPFRRWEVKAIERELRKGARVIVLGYYQNEDGISDVVNSLTSKFGLLLGRDLVRDEKSNDSDPLFPVTSKVFAFNRGVTSVVMPLSASVWGGKPFLLSESGKVMGALKSVGEGELVLLGTCVFWDNYSIDKYSNRAFALNLLSNKTLKS